MKVEHIPGGPLIFILEFTPLPIFSLQMWSGSKQGLPPFHECGDLGENLHKYVLRKSENMLRTEGSRKTTKATREVFVCCLHSAIQYLCKGAQELS